MIQLSCQIVGGSFAEKLPLAGIETALAGQNKADHAHQCKQMQIAAAEHFNTQHDRGEGGIGGAAEQTNQAQCTAKAGIQSQQTAYYAAEGGADAEGGDDLTALKTCGKGDGSKEHLENKVKPVGNLTEHGAEA